MSEPMTPEVLAGIRERSDKTVTLCGGAHSISAAAADRLALLDEVERRREAAEANERAMLQVIAERDAYSDLLDRFAYTVAPVEVIGEHSSANDPWFNALEMVTPAAEADRLRAAVETLKAAVRHLHSEYRIYRECGHGIHENEDDMVELDDGQYVCRSGYAYSVCHECCAPGDEQSEVCVDEHDHAGCFPCATRRLLVPAESTGGGA